MDKWDDKEKRDDRRQRLKEKIGKYMFVCASTILVVYMGTILLDLYLRT